jgi:uncharacterized protein
MSLEDKLKNQLELQRRNLERLRHHPQAEDSPTSLPTPEAKPSGLAAHLDHLRQREQKRPLRPHPTVPAVPIVSASLPDDLFLPSTLSPFVFLDRESPLEGCSRLDHQRLLALAELMSSSTMDIPAEKTLFLDTETTGLSGGTGTYAFLVGIGFWGDQGFRIQQYFIRQFHEEKSMLEKLGERLEEARMVVTFNGKMFDLPLLESRFVMSHLPFPLRNIYHLDLLFPARRLWKLRLKDCSLSNLEKQILNVERGEDVPGHIIPGLYFNYLQTGRPRGISAIVEHNHQDIISLARLALEAASRLLANQPDQQWHPAELLGAGRYFQALGREQLALSFHQAAAQSSIEGELAQEATIRLARLHKSRQENHLAIPLWEQLTSMTSPFSLEASQCLAIYYEHRAKDYEKALAIVQKVLVELVSPSLLEEWNHRLRRLEAKQQRRPSDPKLNS